MKTHPLEYLLAVCLVLLAITGIIEWGNFLNSRLPTIHAPLTRDTVWWILPTNTVMQ